MISVKPTFIIRTGLVSIDPGLKRIIHFFVGSWFCVLSFLVTTELHIPNAFTTTIGDATEELKKRGLDWKEDQMISWGLCKDVGDLHNEAGGKKYVIREMEALKAIGAVITKEVDLMSAMKFRMNKADKALWMDMKFYKNKRIAEGRKHRRYREVVQSSILHSCESWSWNKEMVDAFTWMRKQEFGSHEFKKMESNGAEFGVVPGQSDQESKTKIC